MRDDINDLPITKSDLAELTNLELFDNFSLSMIAPCSVTIFGILISPLSKPDILWFVYLISFSTSLLPLFLYLNFKKYTGRSPLKGLLSDIKRFNSLIKSIHINDQLEEAGNLSVKLKDRERIIEALKLTRQDLCRALKTERILRENKKFIDRNPALFENNLIALTTLQVDDQASEQGRLLDEALQIALSTQEELRRFQKRDY
jgi:hypothetical protein